jgi:DNA-binding response OmpR family regulator
MTRVLVVDDSLTVRMDLKEAFDAAGFETTLAKTIAEAKRAIDDAEYDLFVLDVVLPDGDGVELLADIKQRTSTPVVLLSTEAEVHDRIRGLKTGANEYVGKPYDVAYIVARARELVRASGTTQSSASRTRVLVIDDSATFLEALKAQLEDAGYDVATAHNGMEGLRVAADVRPSAIIVDGVMPDIDGATVVRRVRLDTALRRTPCILLTASQDRAEELRALDSGADAFVRKSEELEVILARLAAILRSNATLAEDDAPASVLGPKKILAVDDSMTYLQELGARLGREGYDVALARSGEQALALLAVEAVDCILLDVVMPGLSGHETCARIKASPALREIPLVMLTAREDRAAMLDGMNAGADDYISKSSDFDVLCARLRAQLRRKQFEDENRSVRDRLLQSEIEASEARAARDLAETRAVLLADLERKNAELARATQELEAFSYSVSHDLRAPLRAIDGFAQTLVEDHAAKLGDDGRRVIDVIQKNARKMSALIDDLLEFSRATRKPAKFGNVDMTALAREVATEVVEAVAKTRVVDLRVGDLPRITGDAALLRQVWTNLLSNAVKYTRPRERAIIEVEGQDGPREAVFTVRDNGVGFDEHYMHKLFGVFQRLHAASEFEGTGVGLALAARIVQRHGGTIRAASTLGEGATFTFVLPHHAHDGAKS